MEQIPDEPLLLNRAKMNFFAFGVLWFSSHRFARFEHVLQSLRQNSFFVSSCFCNDVYKGSDTENIIFPKMIDFYKILTW